MNNSPIYATINSTTVEELADATSLNIQKGKFVFIFQKSSEILNSAQKKRDSPQCRFF